ncbi:hypothetical protein [Kitasatospora sp. NPDC006786]|uniref:hypothetical protein n=1 Tax=unclassified Kitasatospora TaxID=2633591 RepID=UPI0033CBD74D
MTTVTTATAFPTTTGQPTTTGRTPGAPAHGSAATVEVVPLWAAPWPPAAQATAQR